MEILNEMEHRGRRDDKTKHKDDGRNGEAERWNEKELSGKIISAMEEGKLYYAEMRAVNPDREHAGATAGLFDFSKNSHDRQEE